MTGIKLIVGLGNPGEKYANTRHNAGFWLIDLLAQQSGSRLAAEAKLFGIAGKWSPYADKWLLKPTTFMNASGKSVAALANYYKLTPAEILVVHDELDLPPGQAKLKFGGGHGGHNGLRDIHAALNTPDYWRLRIGIGHPGHKAEVVNFVLKAAGKDEQQAIDDSIDKSIGILKLLTEGQFEKAMLQLHSK
ncbi:MAG TPA: aminoacyl-tRNA hydrolase [Methylophilus sp.]